MRQRVFALWHVHEFDDGTEDSKFIGCFSSRENAEAALAELQAQPGFSDLPEGFEVAEYTLDAYGWKEGFVTVPGDD